MPVFGPTTNFSVIDPNTNQPQDLGSRYVSKSYLLDFYPNIVPANTEPGLWTFGANNSGQLAQNNQTYFSSPVQVGSLNTWKQVACGYAFSMAIKTDGTLWSWGQNNNGQLGNGTIVNYSSAIQVGSLNNWKQVACGTSHVLAIKTDGTMWSWGNNSFGQLANGANTVNYSSPVQIGSLTNWLQVSAGQNFWAAVRADGTLWSCGYSGSGQLGNNTNGFNARYSSPIQVGSLTSWKQVACGYAFTAAIQQNNTMWCWGSNANGQLGQGNPAYYSSPVQVGSMTNWRFVGAVQQTWLSVKTDGSLWSCGYGFNGELGNNVAFSPGYSSPIQIGNLSNWKSVGTGGTANTVGAIKTDGTLWTWGKGLAGQGGVSYTGNYYSPVQVGSNNSWKSVGMGQTFTAAIADGYI